MPAKSQPTNAVEAGSSPLRDPGGEGRTLRLFLVGHGLVGGALLGQLRDHREALLRDRGLGVEVVGIADRRLMLVEEGGIDPGAWEETLARRGRSSDLGEFAALARRLALPSTVFVDCTASPEPPALYPSLLEAGVAVVTPNKRGNTGSLASWRGLREASRRSGAPYLYETTVGAGLPIISTMRDLLVSGDRILRIEAVLSGTLGYLLSNYDGRTRLSSLVRRAKELGYTEPDPREDLGALDFARKALILARESGFPFEESEASIEPLVSRACLEAPGLEAFYAALEAEEEGFRARYEAARARGRGLVYAAAIDAGGIRIGLRETGPGEPLSGLRDAENVVTFTTERYSSMPLVVRGPGAGAAVTAGGVFADLVRAAT